MGQVMCACGIVAMVAVASWGWSGVPLAIVALVLAAITHLVAAERIAFRAGAAAWVALAVAGAWMLYARLPVVHVFWAE